ncbi:MAG: hypothetical protein DHS20C21_18040 [Gemmatimonadota bacterium]|nr:MAG: hypothetical protein DHS20C21_18040 [Gemmatimonadota bacterium]
MSSQNVTHPKWGSWSYDPKNRVIEEKSNGYYIPLDEFGTAKEAVDWIAQICEKEQWLDHARCIGGLVSILDHATNLVRGAFRSRSLEQDQPLSPKEIEENLRYHSYAHEAESEQKTPFKTLADLGERRAIREKAKADTDENWI